MTRTSSLHFILLACTYSIALIVSGCGGNNDGGGSIIGGDDGVVLPSCTENDLFQGSAVSMDKISYVAPIGTMAPVGGSPLPKGHTGFMLNTDNVPVTSPGDIVITSIKEVTYLNSPTREGYTDYAVNFGVCKEVSGTFGHLSSLSSAISEQMSGMSCSTYSTVDETVQACEVNVSIAVSKGDPLGTAGTLPHSPAFDLGMKDTRVSNHVNPSRYGNSPGNICPWDWFVDVIKSDLYSVLGSMGVPNTESPQCGTMSVDLAGTAKGRWTLMSAPADGEDPTASDFFVLAPNPYASETEVVISTRIAALDTSSLPEFTIQASGRINIDPENITPDSLIYCYDSDLANSTFSYLVRMSSSSVLIVEKTTHVAGGSVCNNDPGTWAFSGNAVDLIR